MTNGDVERIADAVYRKLDENALSDIRSRLDGLEATVGSMSEELSKVAQRTEEIPYINRNIAALREHAGI